MVCMSKLQILSSGLSRRRKIVAWTLDWHTYSLFDTNISILSPKNLPKKFKAQEVSIKKLNWVSWRSSCRAYVVRTSIWKGSPERRIVRETRGWVHSTGNKGSTAQPYLLENATENASTCFVILRGWLSSSHGNLQIKIKASACLWPRIIRHWNPYSFDFAWGLCWLRQLQVLRVHHRGICKHRFLANLRYLDKWNLHTYCTDLKLLWVTDESVRDERKRISSAGIWDEVSRRCIIA